METNTKVKKKKDRILYGFVHDSLQKLDTSVEWAKTIAEGGSLDDRYYLSGEGGKIDYEAPNAGLILSVVAYGKELDIPPMRSLIMIIPKDGRYLIRGDQAKAMIFSSGLVKEWKESTSGSIDDGSFKYSITATRKDGLTLTREFGVEEAKRAELWVTQDKLNGAHGNKYRASTWFRHPGRMCMYRTLGFLSRDLFPELFGGMIIFEEHGDYPDVAAVFVETKGGEIPLANKAGKEAKTEKESAATKKKAGRRDEELGTEASKAEALAAKAELAAEAGSIIIGSLTIKKQDEGEDFMDYLQEGDIITTSYKTGPYKVHKIILPTQHTVEDPVAAVDIPVPDEYFSYSLVLTDPENPRKSKSFINNLIIKDKKIVSQISDDMIYVIPKDPPSAIPDDTDVRGAPGVVSAGAGHDIKTETEVIKDLNPWANLEAIIKAFAVYTEEELIEMDKKIYKLAGDMLLDDLIDVMPGRKTNKKYRSVIMAAQAGDLASMTQNLLKDQVQKALKKTIKKSKPAVKDEKVSHPPPGETDQKPASDGTTEVDAAIQEQGLENKFNIFVPNIPGDREERDFQDARKIAFAMTDVGIDNNGWNRIASELIYNQQKGLSYLTVYNTKEAFCKKALTVDIHYFINQHEG